MSASKDIVTADETAHGVRVVVQAGHCYVDRQGKEHGEGARITIPAAVFSADVKRVATFNADAKNKELKRTTSPAYVRET